MPQLSPLKNFLSNYRTNKSGREVPVLSRGHGSHWHRHQHQSLLGKHAVSRDSYPLLWPVDAEKLTPESPLKVNPDTAFWLTLATTNVNMWLGTYTRTIYWPKSKIRDICGGHLHQQLVQTIPRAYDTDKWLSCSPSYTFARKCIWMRSELELDIRNLPVLPGFIFHCMVLLDC